MSFRPKAVTLWCISCAIVIVLTIAFYHWSDLKEAYYTSLLQEGSAEKQLDAARWLSQHTSLRGLTHLIEWCQRAQPNSRLQYDITANLIGSFEHLMRDNDNPIQYIIQAIECPCAQYAALALLRDSPAETWHLVRDSVLPLATGIKDAAGSTDKGDPREAARDVVIAMGAESKHDVIQLLEGDDKKLQYRAHLLLYKIGKPVVPDLVSLLQKHANNRQLSYILAVRSLGLIGKEARAAATVLVQHLEMETNTKIVSVIIRALADIGQHPDIVMRIAREHLSHNDPLTRRDALFSLAVLGADAAGAMGNIITSLDDHNEEVRGAAASALGYLGPLAQIATSKLHALAQDDADEEVRDNARRAFEKISRAQ